MIQGDYLRNKNYVYFLVILVLIEFLILYNYTSVISFEYSKYGYELGEAKALLETYIRNVAFWAIFIIVNVQLLVLAIIHSWLNKKTELRTE
jgi:hypothetical protein